MSATMRDGWLTIPYDGADSALVEIGIGDDWAPAFLDYVDGERVAKIRPAVDLDRRTTVSLRVAGHVTTQGRYRP